MGFADFLGNLSGNKSETVSEKLLFDSVIGFRGIVDGVGTSTIIQALAIEISQQTDKRVCVVDTNILYPTQYNLLCGAITGEARSNLKDWFSVEVPIAQRIIDTKFKRVNLLGCFNRRISDAFSSTDTTKLAQETFDRLKDLFDIVIVDLSHEWSQIAMEAAVQCNKIYTVLDLSARCVSNIQQSLNNLSISAVPFAKCRQAILNKYSISGVTGIGDIIAKAHLDIVAQIPYSVSIYQMGSLGKSPWQATSVDPEIAAFNAAVNMIFDAIVHQTPLASIDMYEQEEIEKAVAASPIKNKVKARKEVIRQRQAMLHPASPEEMEKARQQRVTKVELRNSQTELPDDGEGPADASMDMGFNLSTRGGRDDADLGAETSNAFEAFFKKSAASTAPVEVDGETYEHGETRFEQQGKAFGKSGLPKKKEAEAPKLEQGDNNAFNQGNFGGFGKKGG